MKISCLVWSAQVKTRPVWLDFRWQTRSFLFPKTQFSESGFLHVYLYYILIIENKVLFLSPNYGRIRLNLRFGIMIYVHILFVYTKFSGAENFDFVLLVLVFHAMVSEWTSRAHFMVLSFFMRPPKCLSENVGVQLQRFSLSVLSAVISWLL